MKIIIPGGSGQIGRILIRAFRDSGDECVILTRNPGDGGRGSRGVREVMWDGRTLGSWVSEFEGADVVINLAGRSVDCRYSKRNLAEMMSSRIDSTRVVGEAIAATANPPRVWLQASTATIYAHRFDAPNDELTGVIGGREPDAPPLWAESIAIARAWEATCMAAHTPRTRKVFLRSAMTMSADRGGVFHVLARHCALGFGKFGDGRQFVSWIHEHDFVAAIRFLIEHSEISGPVNLCAPNPVTNAEFFDSIGRALGKRFLIPVPCWQLEIATFFLRTESELLLKSRRVVPIRLIGSGFKFLHPEWREAAADLVGRWKREGE